MVAEVVEVKAPEKQMVDPIIFAELKQSLVDEKTASDQIKQWQTKLVMAQGAREQIEKIMTKMYALTGNDVIEPDGTITKGADVKAS